MTIIAKICPLLKLVRHDNYLYIHLRLFYWSEGGLHAKVCVIEWLDGCVMIFTLWIFFTFSLWLDLMSDCATVNRFVVFKFVVFIVTRKIIWNNADCQYSEIKTLERLKRMLILITQFCENTFLKHQTLGASMPPSPPPSLQTES